MLGRLVYVFAVASMMVLVCAGVVLAQSQDAPDRQAPASEEFVEDISGLEAGDPIPGKYIIILDDSVVDPASVAEDLSGELELDPTSVYDDALKGFAAEVRAGKLTTLRADPRVEAVVRDRVVEATAAQRKPTGINRVDADQSSTLAGNGAGAVNADVAILDSGIYKQHDDLNITGGVNCVGNDPKAFSDGDGHGTHVAGTAAAKDNDIGVVGVAPGARLKAVKVLGADGSGTFGTVICGIDWVTAKNTDGNADNDIEVANMSLGATVPGADDPGCGWTLDSAANRMNQAICNSVDAGVFYAVAAGNSSINFANDVPASFDQVLTVTAMADFDGRPGGEAMTLCGGETDDKFASFSNYTTTGSPDEPHTIAGPGVCIRSTWNDGRYNTISGTSMASPHVAGTAALCIAEGQCPDDDPAVTLDKLLTDAQQRSSGDPLADNYYGFIGDPNTGAPATYYGYLVYAGGY